MKGGFINDPAGRKPKRPPPSFLGGIASVNDGSPKPPAGAIAPEFVKPPSLNKRRGLVFGRTP